MKGKIAALAAAGALLLSVAGVFAKGGPNGTFVRFDNLNSYWKQAGSGLLQEWRTTDNRHLVFKPVSKFSEADCDEGYLNSFLWTAHTNYDQSYPYDEADLENFLDVGSQYWVCIYEWSSDKPQEYPELVQTLNVYANDVNGEDSMILESGKEYKFMASGTAFAGDTIDFDAEHSKTTRIVGDGWTDDVSGYTSYGTSLLDLQLNEGLTNWGAYSSSHTYEMDYSGMDSSVNFTIYDIYYPNNTGYLTVDIYQMP